MINSNELAEVYMNVWQPIVPEYLALGWMLANDDAMIHDNRGGHATWLLAWPCACEPRLPERLPSGMMRESK
jgi:hypothetical protein